ncbi:HAD family hydrolase [Fictibacillus nanhaiensis]|uniref:HAD family hydrolase n=2 Tax=Fictibacillus nanhaiensis TaxID=742169 RepID=A0ABS2ZVQ8_9BACL|nr:HAD family hydrolase [Fictibacillus nanhaiensis]
MTMRSKKAAVFFDLDNTLFDYEASFKKASLFAFRCIFSIGEKNKKLEEKWFPHYKSYCDLYWYAYERAWITRKEYQRKRLSSSLHAVGINNFSDKEIQQYQQYFEENIHYFVEPYPWIKEIIQLLNRKKITYGIISNGEAAVQRNKIKHLPFDIPEKHIYISSEIKVAKPSPEIFRVVSKRVEASAFYYVGDSYSLDIIPAVQAEWTAIWWNPSMLSVTHDKVPYHYCTSSDELIETITKCIE